MRRILLAAALIGLAPACSGEANEADAASSKDEVTVNTRTAQALRQYEANVAFAAAYTPRCKSAPGLRVIVTGYGRFGENKDNASGRIVEALTGAPYPMTQPSADGAVDPPGPQTSVATRTFQHPSLGPVTICGMVLPVYWDLAPILLAREIEALQPDLVIMNGVKTGVTGFPLRIELGSENSATTGEEDGSGVLEAYATEGWVPWRNAEVIAGGPKLAPSLLSWSRVGSAMNDVIQRDAPLAKTVRGVGFGAYPSSWLTFLCNDIVYVTNYLMDHPEQPVTLLRASTKVSGANGVETVLHGDYRKTPRAFVHWPDVPRAQQVAASEAVLQGIYAQLSAAKAGEPPTRGSSITPTLR